MVSAGQLWKCRSVSLFAEWQSGRGWLMLPNLLLVVQAYSHVLKIEVVVHGLHIEVICTRFCIAW